MDGCCEIDGVINNKEKNIEEKQVADRMLRETEALMHQMCEVAEFLADTINVLIPSKLGQKKVAFNAKRDIYEVINFDFKTPINLIKHDSSEMHWIKAWNSQGHCFGFVLQSLLSPRLSGPASKVKPVAEGYSYSYLLRVVLPHLYKICNLAEYILLHAGVFEVEECGKLAAPFFDVNKLTGLVTKINQLPLFGFPNEAGLLVPRIGVGENCVFLDGDEVISRIPGVISINVTATHAGDGYALQLPFATMQKRDPRKRINSGK